MLELQIEQNLLFANQLDQQFLLGQANNLMKKRIDFCDLYLQKTASESFSIDEGIIKSGSFAIEEGIGIRAVCGEKAFLSYSNSLNPKTIQNLVNNIFVEPLPSTRAHPIIQFDQANILYTSNNPISLSSGYEKTELLGKIDVLGRALPYVTNVIANLSLEYDEICIVRGDTNIIGDIRPLVHLGITIIINKNGQIEKGNSGCGGRYLISNLNDTVLETQVNHAYQQALLKSEAVTAPAGQMSVVLGNAWAGVILHEAVGHGLEGDFNRKGSSAFSNRIGEQVAAKDVTIIDNGSIPNRRGSLTIDDEGNPTQKNVLIENGILKGYIFDELNARLMGRKSSGNGRRESFSCSPMPRMTNTYMEGGKYNHEEIIASVENGLYAETFEGGSVDITSGQFVFNANVAWVIKNGKLAYPVKGCALVGNGPECLKHVSMVGNNSELDNGIGNCGKNGQTVPVGVGQPTIRIDGGLVVGGG
jgi:TldD protein